MNYVNDVIESIHNSEFKNVFPVEKTNISVLDPVTIDPDVLYKELYGVAQEFNNVNFYPKLNPGDLALL